MIGRALRNVRSNFMFGVRTRWTLTSELSWRKTHRLASGLFAAFGVALIVASIVAMELLVWVVVGGVVVVLVVTFAYSYLVWRDEPNRQTGLSADPPTVQAAGSTESRDTP